MKRICKCLLFFLILPFIFNGCQKNNVQKPISHSDVVPPQITHIKIRRLPGGVVVYYKIPKGNTFYVLAKSQIKDGVSRQAMSSFYLDSIRLDGFPDSKNYKIELYSVSRSEVKSKPVVIEVKPLPSPIQEVTKTIKLNAVRGGISVSFSNNGSNADLAICVLAENDQGKLTYLQNFYTDSTADTLYARGLDTTARKFGVYLKNEWGNHFDTLTATLKPLYEVELDKKKFKIVHLPNDSWAGYGRWGAASATFDGVIGGGKYTYASIPADGSVQSFTIDLGVKSKLYRLVYYPPASGQFAYSLIPRRFQIFGSNDPSPNGFFDDSWTLLKTCDMIKPSGSPQGVFTGNDIEYVRKGIDFIISDNAPAVKYIRIRVLSLWDPAGENFYIRELTFFGKPL